MAVLTALPTFRHEGKPFLAFVYGICAHKVADAHRVAARSRTHSVAEVPDAPSTERGPEQCVVANSTAAVVEELLQQPAGDPAGNPPAAGCRRPQRRGDRGSAGDDGRRRPSLATPRAGQTSAPAVDRRRVERAVGVMAGRPGRRRYDPNSPLVDLDAVFADDALIDDIAARPWSSTPRNRFATGLSAEHAKPGTVLDTDPVADLFDHLAAGTRRPPDACRSVDPEGRRRAGPGADPLDQDVAPGACRRGGDRRPAGGSDLRWLQGRRARQPVVGDHRGAVARPRAIGRVPLRGPQCA